MKLRIVAFTLLLFNSVLSFNALSDSKLSHQMFYNVDSIIDQSFTNSEQLEQILEQVSVEDEDPVVVGFHAVPQIDMPDFEKIKREMVIQYVEESFLQANPLTIDLVFKGYQQKFTPNRQIDYKKIYFGNAGQGLLNYHVKNFQVPTPEKAIVQLRSDAARYILNTAPELYRIRKDQLKNVSDMIYGHKVDSKPLESLRFTDGDLIKKNDKGLVVQKVKYNPWSKRANALFQFSQNYVSSNWYQGGSDNVAILGILNGQLNYDNKKNIQYENNFEWRTGFNTVEGDTLRLFNTNDDILKLNSKLGVKAGGNWFYSGSVDFSTHFFNSYRAINSDVKKATFLTPVRLNVGIGLDYKYKKLISLMLSPVSFKYIYVNDTIGVNRKSFGISEGNTLKQFGSSFRAQSSFVLAENVNVDSKLSFYTNYEKVEIDLEVVSTFVVNRFLSTRLSLNPRFDNTMILGANEKAKIQFKELLTFGISYRLLD